MTNEGADSKVPVRAELKSTPQGSRGRDEYDVYGELVAHNIRKLKSEFARATVQYLVNGILYEAQLGKYVFDRGSSDPGIDKSPKSDEPCADDDDDEGNSPGRKSLDLFV